MSGKSRLLINLSAQWYPYFVNQPISEIIYVGNNWQPEYEKRLRAVGQALKIKVFMVRGGLQNEMFQKCWERKRRSLRVVIGDREPAKDRRLIDRRIGKNNKDDNNDDDDNDDNDDEDSDYDEDDDYDFDNDSDRVFYSPWLRKKYRQTLRHQQQGEKNQEESCAAFINRLIQHHQRGPAASIAKRKTSEDKARLPYLARRPKMSSLKKLKQFLRFEDRSLQKSGFLALEKPGGTIITRSRGKQQQNQEQQQLTSTSAPPPKRRRQQQPQQQPLNRKRKATTAATVRKLPRMDDDKNNVDDDDDNNNNNNKNNNNKNEHDLPPLSERNRQLLDDRLKAEQDEEITFQNNCLLLLDDVLTGSANDDHDIDYASDVAKKSRDQYVQNLQWIQSLATEFSHHARINFCLVSQSTLSSSAAGSNLAARSLRILRQNVDSHIIFQQPVADTRQFLQSVSVGEDYQALKQIYNDLVDRAPGESPEDPRSSHPYVCLCLTNNTRPHLRIRQHLYNLYDENLKPYVPPSFINYDAPDNQHVSKLRRVPPGNHFIHPR